MKHQISMSDIIDYQFEFPIAGSHGREESKTLTGIVENGEIQYRLVSHGEKILSTDDIQKAVDSYNLL